MTVEVATYIADLQPVNPPSTDPRSQGDDHIRLIKQVLQNTIAQGSRQWQIPGTTSVTTSATVTKANGEDVFYCNTAAGAITLTLPSTLASIDAGWKIYVVKTSSDANPVFIAPATGTLNSGGIAGLAKARRAIPGVQCVVIWDGANWFVSRAISLPIGSSILYHGSPLPAGYEWPSGQTLAAASTNYPEYNAVFGSGLTPDMRGRVGVVIDNLGGSDAARLSASGSGLAGIRTGVGNGGGSPANTLVTGNLPPYTPAGGVTGSASVTGNNGTFWKDGSTVGLQGGVNVAFDRVTPTASGSISASFTGTAQGGTSTPFNNCQPALMCTRVLVVE